MTSHETRDEGEAPARLNEGEVPPPVQNRDYGNPEDFELPWGFTD